MNEFKQKDKSSKQIRTVGLSRNLITTNKISTFKDMFEFEGEKTVENNENLKQSMFNAED